MGRAGDESLQGGAGVGDAQTMDAIRDAMLWGVVDVVQ